MNRSGPLLLVFVVGFLLLRGLEVYYAPFAPRGMYFQEHSSEDMMQTVSLADLRERAGETLLALHIQPPLLDGLRALLARLWPDLPQRALVVQVDRCLYFLWSLAYSAMGALVFQWLQALTSSTRVAVVAAFVFLLHPAAIFYATFLEGTLLTSCGILLLCHALWRVPARGAIPTLVCAYVLLFLVRSIFQWPALVVIVASLLLRGAGRRAVLAFALPASLVVGLLMAKQYVVFGSTSTSSFAGSSCLQALGVVPTMGVSSSPPTALGPLYPHLFPGGDPPTLTRLTKITGAHNFNSLADLGHERELLRRCVERLVTDAPWRTLRAWLTNVSIFFQPSSRYVTAHAIVDRLPWRGAFDWVFSGPRLVVLLAAGVLLWIRGRTRSEIRAGLGLALPVLFVFAACVAFERDENMRYKFFIEPVLYVFLVVQGAAVLRRRCPRHASVGDAAADPPA